jgi:hypothetical protein
MSSTRTSPKTRLLCWQGSSMPRTSSVKRGADHPGTASSVATPLTSLPIAPRETSSTPPTSMTAPDRTTLAIRATTRRRTSSKIIIRRRSSRRSCLECDFDFSSENSSSSEEDEKIKSRKATSPGYALWLNLHRTTLTPTLM